MQHDFVRQLRCVNRVSFAPIVTDSVGKYAAGAVEGRGWNSTANFRVALETVFGILVPKVECAITSCGTKCAVDRMK